MKMLESQLVGSTSIALGVGEVAGSIPAAPKPLYFVNTEDMGNTSYPARSLHFMAYQITPRPSQASQSNAV